MSSVNVLLLQQNLNDKNEEIAEKDETIAKLRAELEATRLEVVLERKCRENQMQGEELATAMDMDDVLRKSDRLLRSMIALDSGEEVKQQWSAVMTSHEDYKERLSKIEALVAKRSDQLQMGDQELKLCRQIRGLCNGAQKSTRKWSHMSPPRALQHTPPRAIQQQESLFERTDTSIGSAHALYPCVRSMQGTAVTFPCCGSELGVANVEVLSGELSPSTVHSNL